MKPQAIRVLLVDDSVYNLRLLTELFRPIEDIEVVGCAHTSADAQAQMAKLNPDCVTCDLDMPRMEGILFLKMAMSQFPKPILVFGSEAQKGPLFQVFELGAFDVLFKPTRYLPENDAQFDGRVIDSVRATKNSSPELLIRRSRASERIFAAESSPVKERSFVPAERLVILGASTGGPPAVQNILRYIEKNTRAAVVVAQHMPEKFTRTFAERLNRVCAVVVVEAADGEALRAGHAYIAPGGMRLEIVGSLPKAYFRVTPAPKEDRFCPSVDRLLCSAAPIFTRHLLAVILTGMGSDGALGIRAVAQAGGQTVAESKRSAVVWGMPEEAIQTGCVRRTLDLDEVVTCVGQFSFHASGA